MPSRSPTAHFLGIELATDQLRAAVVDEQLDLVGVECVDFDSELGEFQTHGGIFTTPGEAYTTPVEMWIKALDLLLQKLQRDFDLSKIKSIGGSAQLACVWWKNTISANVLQFVDPSQSIHEHLFGPSTGSGGPFLVANTPVAQDTSTMPQAVALEHALGGADLAASRVGTTAHAHLLAAHALRMRETQPEVWHRTGKLTLASTLLSSLLLGGWASTAEAEACATGMWSALHRTWDDAVLEIVAGGGGNVARLRAMLGEVDTHGGGRKVGNVSQYFVERFGFSPETILLPFTSDYLSTFLSLCPSPTDAILQFGPMDVMLSPAPQYLPSRLYTLVPHPAQEPNEKRRYVAVLMSRNGDVPRALVRDMYTKSWSAFDRLVAIVPPGGSIGLDDKLFSFWHLQAEAFPFSHVKGIFRFETGIKTSEFRDLRANPRCLLESQLLSFRIRYARMRSSPLYSRGSSTPTPQSHTVAGLALNFDPYSPTPLPRRLICTGAAANFPSIVNLLGDIFNAPVYIPQTQLESAHAVAPASIIGSGASANAGPAKAQYAAAHRNAPAPGFPSRAALGGAYVARWAWSRERSANGSSSVTSAYEDEVRRLLARRWNLLRSKQQHSHPSSAGGGSGTHSPAPYLKHQRSAGLGADVLVEEDEEEEDVYRPGMSGFNSGGVMPTMTPPPRVRTATGGTTTTTPSSALATPPTSNAFSPGGSSTSAFTALTSPDVSSPYSHGHGHPSVGGSMLGMGTGLGMGYVPGASPTNVVGVGIGAGVGVGVATPTDASHPFSNGSVPIGSGAPTTTGTGGIITPLTPVGALPTGDGESQLGWTKVAEPDVDAFLAYASIVPEFVRLEGLLVKALV